MLSLALNASASASPSCLSDKQPFELAGDTIHWTMTIAPGADCIQGVRWSYMQIYDVSVVSAPKHGKIVMVGIGFRYYADPGFKEADSFTLAVTGMNKKDPGRSYVQIEVKPRPSLQLSSAR
ncbi:Ig-like domain-containing protein [Bradyrhizobium sp. dw_78]|uniref:Ig-like domain-containing protein n=1 Tax=Bradyrhizobium sp. dw_78 TaxID=2719793 RepID=UPI00201C88ED|nr:Ig-like domain-containing protein [Bradyrhizobium sp. dw_78]